MNSPYIGINESTSIQWQGMCPGTSSVIYQRRKEPGYNGEMEQGTNQLTPILSSISNFIPLRTMRKIAMECLGYTNDLDAIEMIARKRRFFKYLISGTKEIQRVVVTN